MTLVKRLNETIQKEWARERTEHTDYGTLFRSRMMDYRAEGEAVVKVEKPFNVGRARALGYKAKPGITVARVRIRRGGGLFIRPRRARKPKRMQVASMTRRKSVQVMAETRAQKHFPNMEVLNSYKVGQDGKNQYFEVILVDPRNSSVLADKDMKWIAEPQHQGRVYRGKTSAGQKSRGLLNPVGSRGSEKVRPGARANDRKGR
ncbi:MAG: 50S ribosomal protein L15e [Candidatus Diapherotrites archaeon]|uniref:50S ribosomal protein L15e n=1 Tax=Candidatus Iainarchaeum sp. TaxID=3101447 RepID=A0A8T4CB74_9ARCH|nr:50S ribosomal protein L15e [Candidatus Diapherotrites archaeon]